MTTPLLSVRGLHKYFGDKHAVRGLDFELEPGICLGLLGPNGAGKTTTIEMLEGIKKPSRGELRYRGVPLVGRALAGYKARTGIQFQATALMDFLRVREVLELFSSFYARPASAASLIQLCDLGEFVDQYANKVSGGQRQRLLLAVALAGEPEILFLDEPTTGLDPQARRHFWRLLERIKGRGTTVVLNTHHMEEAELLCDELLILDHGEMVARGAPAALLRAHFDRQQVLLERVPELRIDPVLATPLATERGAAFATDRPAAFIGELAAGGADIDGLQVRSPNLEDLFLKLTGHGLRD
ncbi:MAG: ABC transporter ATP-binding protein [Cellvibrionales bacterium]|nr:ABC transporter ATP-binding protein [Cellvibrionales bacterium]